MSTPETKALIQRLRAAQDDYRTAKRHADDLKKELDAVSEEVLTKLTLEGADSLSVKGAATVSVDCQEVPTNIDWDILSRYVIENEATFLFQRRLNAAAVRELIAQQGELPGVELVQHRKLRITRT